MRFHGSNQYGEPPFPKWRWLLVVLVTLALIAAIGYAGSVCAKWF